MATRQRLLAVEHAAVLSLAGHRRWQQLSMQHKPNPWVMLAWPDGASKFVQQQACLWQAIPSMCCPGCSSRWQPTLSPMIRDSPSTYEKDRFMLPT